jgi:hypothetical protein
MKNIFLLIGLASLVGCGTTNSVNMHTEIPSKISFTYIDQRTQTQKQSSQTDSAKYYGDDALHPPAPDLLKATLAKFSGAALDGKTVTLTDLTINVSTANTDSNGGVIMAPSAGVGILAMLVIEGIDKWRGQKSVNVLINGMVGDKEFSAQQSDTYSGNITEANIQATLQAALDLAAKDAGRAAKEN